MERGQDTTKQGPDHCEREERPWYGGLASNRTMDPENIGRAHGQELIGTIQYIPLADASIARAPSHEGSMTVATCAPRARAARALPANLRRPSTPSTARP